MATFEGLKLDLLNDALRQPVETSGSIRSIFKNDIEVTEIEEPKDNELLAREMRASQFARALKRMNGENFVLELPSHDHKLTVFPYKIMPNIMPLNGPFEFESKESPPKQKRAYSDAQIKEANSFLCFD